MIRTWWHTELLQSSLGGKVRITRSARTLRQSLGGRLVLTVVCPSARRKPGAFTPALTWLNVEVTGKSPNCEQIAERTPLRPVIIAIRNVIDPTQWAITCTDFAPVTSRTLATAAG